MNLLHKLEEVEIFGRWNRLEPITRENQGMVNGWEGWEESYGWDDIRMK